MASPEEVETQVRFALSQLPVRNAHHEFEHICRQLTQQFICSNVLPATGPVSAGGDQGRDFETFRSYLREELGPHGAFLGLVSEGTIAFVCTTQADDLLGKLKQDIQKVCASGHPVHEIRAFTLNSVPVASRHKLETETQESYEIPLVLHDAESISNLLARPQGFWIAERFLSIPAQIGPEAPGTEGEFSDEYIERRRSWRDKSGPNPTLGDLIDLKAGLRYAISHQVAREDLPFWLGLVRALLAYSECPTNVLQRGRYELVVATFRGTHDLRQVDDVARAYLQESLSESDPARLQDASALLLYANTAVRSGATSLTPAELRYWNKRLTTRAEDLFVDVQPDTPHRRASLLDAIGHLGLHPALWEADFPASSAETYALDEQDQGVELSNVAGASLPDDFVLADLPRTLSAWTELMDNLEETPLFPIEGLADVLQLLVPLWTTRAEWRQLLDRVDEAVGERSGQHVVAARARDRAMTLLRSGRCLDALDEFHQAKIQWWSGETVRGSLLAMIIIAELYLELRLPQASKSYALAVSYIAALRRDDTLADLVPAGLLMAASADFIAGAWCSSAELYEFGLATQYEFIEDGTDWEKHTAVQNAFLHLAYINACVKIVDPDLADLIAAATAQTGAQDIIEDTLNMLKAKDKGFWESFVDIGLAARPFADLGAVRYIRFSALGTEWTLATANDIESIRLAERLASAAQVVLAALAREDLCLVPTRINVRVENRQGLWTPSAEPIEPLPSNDGREWVVRLEPAKNASHGDAEEHVTELLAILTKILRDVSLLPEEEFLASLERAFERGLGHKLSPGRPYDELDAAFAEDIQPEIHRPQYSTPWDSRYGLFGAHDELCWNARKGPTYSQDRAKELLQTRYQNLAGGLRITVEALASSVMFRDTVETLRASGWLDWHILTAIFNIVMNYRFPGSRSDMLSEEGNKEMMEAAFRQESATDAPVPVGFFDLDSMDNNRQLSMLSLVKHWGLECHQATPDIPAIEQLLADRYGYWDEDVPHDNPFPDSSETKSKSGLVVVRDMLPQHQA